MPVPQSAPLLRAADIVGITALRPLGHAKFHRAFAAAYFAVVGHTTTPAKASTNPVNRPNSMAAISVLSASVIWYLREFDVLTGRHPISRDVDAEAIGAWTINANVVQGWRHAASANNNAGFNLCPDGVEQLNGCA